MSSEGVRRFGTSAKTVRQKVYVEMKLTVSCDCDTTLPQGSMEERLERFISKYLDRSLNTETYLYFFLLPPYLSAALLKLSLPGAPMRSASLLAVRLRRRRQPLDRNRYRPIYYFVV